MGIPPKLTKKKEGSELDKKRRKDKFHNREEKRISLRIKERTQEKRFDVRGQMDDDHHEQKRKIKYLKNSEFPSSTLVLS